MVSKKLLAALALCLCLTACGRETPPEQQPVAPDVSQQPSGILTDVGQAETVQDYYDRTAVIGRNEWIDGWFTETVTWAEEYARLKHPESQAQITFAGGFFAPDGLFRDDLSAGATLWDIALTGADGTTQTVQVQILHFDEGVEGGRRQFLSGLLSGDNILTHKPDVYAYLALDTRFAARMQALPAVSAPENARVVELAGTSGSGHANTWLLGDRHLAVYEQMTGAGKSRLDILDLDTMEPVASWEREGYWYQTDGPEGQLTLRNSHYREEGLADLVQVRLEEGLPVLQEFTLREDAWQVGDTLVTHWQNGLWAGDQLLLQGELGEEDATTTTNYGVLAVLDDHRFLYGCFGWEWLEYYGVYDLQDNSWTSVWDKPDGYLWIPEEGGSKAVAFQWGGEWQWGFHLLDLDTLEATPLPLEYDSPEQALQGSATINQGLDRMAVLDTSDPAIWRVAVRDLADGRELMHWELPAAAVVGQPQVQLVGDRTLAVTLDRYETDTVWVYLFDYGPAA